mgnify:CR=1 FL=1
MAAIELPQLQEATKKTAGFPTVFEIPGSPGELVGARSHKKVIYRIPQTMQPSISTILRKTADEDSYLRII